MRLIESGYDYTSLDKQYRMHPAISAFPRKFFYDSRLQDGISDKQRPWFDVNWKFPVPDIPLMFWDCNNQEEKNPGENSHFNRIEAKMVVDIVKRLLDSGITMDQIGVITPYEAQRALILRRMEQSRIFDYSYLNGERVLDENEKLEVANVDGFQVIKVF